MPTNDRKIVHAMAKHIMAYNRRKANLRRLKVDPEEDQKKSSDEKRGDNEK